MQKDRNMMQVSLENRGQRHHMTVLENNGRRKEASYLVHDIKVVMIKK